MRESSASDGSIHSKHPGSMHLGVLVVRVAFGVSLAAVYGVPRLINAGNYLVYGEDWRFLRTVQAVGFPFPVAFALASALAESLCALLMATGLWTRFNASIVAFN